MTKEKFVKIIDQLQCANELENNIATQINEYQKHVGGLLDEYGMVIAHDGLVVELLEEIMNDKFGDISYFCYELDFGKDYEEGNVVDQDGNVIDFSCAEKLYDYLVIVNE